jgi:hypothetical protein
MIGEGGFHHNALVIDPAKVRDAVDRIYTITNKELKLETADKPIRYDYIDPSKMNHINLKRLKQRKETAGGEDDTD